jgi:hypothetical protein
MRKTLIILATLGTIGFATSQAQAAGSSTTCSGYGNSVTCYTYYY